MRIHQRRHHLERAYTLVELMVVVVIVGVIATLAVIGVRKYVFASKTAEATNMIGQIKAAQGNILDETFAYMNASNGDINAFYPMDGTPGPEKHAWLNPGHSDYQNWRTLGVSSKEPVIFGYVTVAGVPGDGLTPPAIPGMVDSPNWPAPTSPWFIIRASGDQNGDGTYSYFIASSFTQDIAIENEAE